MKRIVKLFTLAIIFAGANLTYAMTPRALMAYVGRYLQLKDAQSAKNLVEAYDKTSDKKARTMADNRLAADGTSIEQIRGSIRKPLGTPAPVTPGGVVPGPAGKSTPAPEPEPTDLTEEEKIAWQYLNSIRGKPANVVLGIPADAFRQQVRDAFKNLALKWSPNSQRNRDLFAANPKLEGILTQIFIIIQNAHNELIGKAKEAPVTPVTPGGLPAPTIAPSPAKPTAAPSPVKPTPAPAKVVVTLLDDNIKFTSGDVTVDTTNDAEAVNELAKLDNEIISKAGQALSIALHTDELRNKYLQVLDDVYSLHEAVPGIKAKFVLLMEPSLASYSNKENLAYKNFAAKYQ